MTKPEMRYVEQESSAEIALMQFHSKSAADNLNITNMRVSHSPAINDAGVNSARPGRHSPVMSAASNGRPEQVTAGTEQVDLLNFLHSRDVESATPDVVSAAPTNEGGADKQLRMEQGLEPGSEVHLPKPVVEPSTAQDIPSLPSQASFMETRMNVVEQSTFTPLQSTDQATYKAEPIEVPCAETELLTTAASSQVDNTSMIIWYGPALIT
jgi:hypothetical protein